MHLERITKFLFGCDDNLTIGSTRDGQPLPVRGNALRIMYYSAITKRLLLQIVYKKSWFSIGGELNDSKL